MTAARVVTSDTAGIELAINALKRGAAIGIPTETVYGLAADASNPSAVASIYAIKGRPSFNPLIAHVASIEMARGEGVMDERAEALATAFWPGPLTLVLPVAANGRTCELARAGLTTIAVRIPSHPVTQALLDELGEPLMSSTLILPGKDMPETDANDIRERLEHEVDLVIDGDHCGVEPTTVVDLVDGVARVLRQGCGSVAVF